MPILDSDIMIQYLRNNADAIKKIIELRKNHARLKTTSINVGELYRGALLSSKVAENVRLIEDFVKLIEVLSFTNDDAFVFGQLSAELQMNGNKIGDMDEVIASMVISRGEIIITRNIKHFEQVNRLKYELW